MPDEDQLFLRPRTLSTYDERHPTGNEFEFLMKQIAALPTRRELARFAFVLLFVGAVLGIAVTELCWRYLPCSST
jgi:hypothetical protein